MSKSIRVSDQLLEQANHSSELFHRSPPQQIEHWAQIGRVMESALAYPSLERVKIAASPHAVEEALALPDTPSGRARALEIIGRRSQKPASKP
jgi:hypothetical protein